MILWSDGGLDLAWVVLRLTKVDLHEAQGVNGLQARECSAVPERERERDRAE